MSRPPVPNATVKPRTTLPHKGCTRPPAPGPIGHIRPAFVNAPAPNAAA